MNMFSLDIDCLRVLNWFRHKLGFDGLSADERLVIRHMQYVSDHCCYASDTFDGFVLDFNKEAHNLTGDRYRDTLRRLEKKEYIFQIGRSMYQLTATGLRVGQRWLVLEPPVS